MPIRKDEKFCKHFLGETEEEATDILQKYNADLTMLSNKCAIHTGLDKDDLKQEATIGLARARRDFDFDRSKNFRILAIYKIKDALREYVTMQGNNVRTPQYIKDTISLINNLKKVVEKSVYVHPYVSFLDIWEISESSDIDENILKEVVSVRESIRNLAVRSHATVSQLLERAEMFPNIDVNVPDELLPDCFSEVSEETDRVSDIYYKEAFERLKDELTEEELDLLYARFVDGYTVRELEKTMDIKASSIVVKTNEILERLKYKEKRILDHENNFGAEKTSSGFDG